MMRKESKKSLIPSPINYAPRRAGRERGDEEAERIGQGTVENIIFFQVIRFPPALFFFVSVMGGNRITYRMKEYYIYYLYFPCISLHNQEEIIKEMRGKYR